MDSLRHVTPLTFEEVVRVLPGMFWDNDCVMLPGLGGFVCNPRSAWYDASKRQMVPPSRDVLFNPRLTTNDGLVANELMAKYGATYREAIDALESMVGKVKRELKNGSSVDLPGIGRLYMESDGLLRFVTDAEFERLLRSFGHASIALSPKEESVAGPAKVVAFPSQEPTAPEQGSSWRIQVGRAAAAVAIPLTLAGAWLLSRPTGSDTLLGSNPLWNAVPLAAEYTPWEDAMDMEAFLLPPEPAEDLRSFVERTDWEGLLEFDLELGAPKAGGLRVMLPVEAPVNPAPEPTPEPAPAPAPVRFLIVGGAFSVQENAQKLAGQLGSEGFDTSLHFQSHNQLTVVAMGGYAEETEARTALAQARAKGHAKAWLKRL
ncbi:SPOR domain-containing protein [Flavobacteriales bacterium]|nr:SPOR domain-containing protein [Flavobacteriales bacterium]